MLTGPSQWENTTSHCLVDVKGLRKLQADSPVQLKVWRGHSRCTVRKVLPVTLGHVLHHLESCTVLTITASTHSVELGIPAQ